MPYPHYQALTLDDLMRDVIEDLLKHGADIEPSKGKACELVGAMLTLDNPRARLSFTETRGKLFSCLGELFWYLSGHGGVDQIAYYLPRYRNLGEDDQVWGAYGPRLFGPQGQLGSVVNILNEKKDSRQAVVQLFDCQDIAEKHKDVPCTCTLQFMLRDGKLHLIVYMRSNDVIWGLTHDVFCFTMLQEIVSRELEVELGLYRHMVGSLHLYECHQEEARSFLSEGWQSTKAEMPDMPAGDQWKPIDEVVRVEAAIRAGDPIDDSSFAASDPYWADLMRLLLVFREARNKNWDEVRNLRQRMAYEVYDPFIQTRLDRAS